MVNLSNGIKRGWINGNMYLWMGIDIKDGLIIVTFYIIRLNEMIRVGHRDLSAHVITVFFV